MAKTRLYIDVEYDDKITDGESIATALDKLLETALSTPGIFSEYGDPSIGGGFYVQWDRGGEIRTEEEWKKLISRIEESFGCELLDEMVHDLKSMEASNVNNHGVTTQVEFVRESLGPDAYKSILAEVENAEREK